MPNEQIIRKMKDDMKMRGFSHWTEQSYLSKTKEIMKYFKKPMEEVKIEELRQYIHVAKQELSVVNPLDCIYEGRKIENDKNSKNIRKRIREISRKK